MTPTEHAKLLRRAAIFARTVFECDELGEDDPLAADAYEIANELDDAALDMETKTIYQRLHETQKEVESAEALRDAADRATKQMIGEGEPER